MKVINKKARFKYELLDRLEAGVVLTGAEVKSIKQQHLSLGEAHVRLLNGEAWLINAHVAPYPFANTRDYDPTRTRKLLLSRRELLRLTQTLEQKKLVLVPTAVYTKKGRVKIEIALARPKKTWQKKEALKRADLDREAERELSSK
jgi:SsrA-binding protein